MKKRSIWKRWLLGIAVPLLIISILICALEFCARDRVWLQNEYEKLDINDYTGMSTEDMCNAFMQMANYMSGKADTMDIEVTVDGEKMLMYNEREISHMVDVRALYSGVIVAKYCFLIFEGISIFLIVLEERKRSIKIISKYYLIAFAGVLGAFLLLGIWAIADFNSFWQVFHIVFLDLESSTFDPAVSRMIRICPAELFQDMVIRIFAWGLGICAAIAAVAGVIVLFKKKENAK